MGPGVDVDPDAVAATQSVKDRFAYTVIGADPANWLVTAGSVLDASFLASLGEFDVVYSWGVLHHTGSMWRALDLAAKRCAADCVVFVALYSSSTYDEDDLATKRTYNCMSIAEKQNMLNLFVTADGSSFFYRRS